MFDFLKKLMSQRTEMQSLKFSELEPWVIDKKKAQKASLERVIPDYIEKIGSQIQKIRQDLGVLKSAELHNKNISVKEEQIMKGNKDAYIFKTESFLSKISPNLNIDNASAYCAGFQQELDALNKNTMKAYYVLQEFFAHESKKAALGIKELEFTVKSLQTQAHGGNSLEFVNAFNILKIKRLRLAALMQQLQEKEADIKNENDKIIVIDKKIAAIEKHTEYAEYKRLSSEKEELIMKLKAKEDELFQAFSVLGKALRKYERMALDPEIITQYLNNPVKALEKDTQLKILEALAGLHKAVTLGSLDLKDKKKEKTLALISGMNESFLKNYLADYNLLLTQKNGLVVKLDNLPVIINHKDLLYRQSHHKSRLEAYKREKGNIEAEMKKIDLQELAGNFINKVQSELGISLEITDYNIPDKNDDKE